MSTRLELDDLPPKYRAQAEAQIAAATGESVPLRNLWPMLPALQES